MSGWIKFEKNIRDDPRFLRMVRDFRNAQALQERFTQQKAVTHLLGGLLQFWMYADTHIRSDDTLDLGIAEINELIGIDNFCQLLPDDWLQVIDADHVKLPEFQAHNGTDAKKRDLTQKRVERHRVRTVTQQSNAVSNPCNADALPDQDQTKTRPRPDQKRDSPPAAPARTEDPPDTEPAWFRDFKLAYPRRGGDQRWRSALKAGRARLAEGHTAEELIDGARRYATYVAAVGKSGTEFVKQAATFLGREKPFLERWDPPRSAAQVRQDSNLEAAREWLEGSNAA